MEVGTMMKKAMFAVVALMFAAVLAAPSQANAQVVFRVGVGPVVVGNAPVVVAPASYVAYAPGYAYPPVVYREHARVGREYARPYAYRHEERRDRDHDWRR
jgi:hypothetical protein